MKIGRNEGCPCGSGKKYKLCCGAAPETESPLILAWRRLNRAVQDHAPKLLSFIAESHGRGAIPEAWEEFTLWSGEPFDPESPQVTLFFHWLFHTWRPDPIDSGVEARCLREIPPTQAYLIARSKGMDPVLYRYLSACLDSPFGFFEVISVDRRGGRRDDLVKIRPVPARLFESRALLGTGVAAVVSGAAPDAQHRWRSVFDAAADLRHRLAGRGLCSAQRTCDWPVRGRIAAGCAIRRARHTPARRNQLDQARQLEAQGLGDHGAGSHRNRRHATDGRG
jgi:hypothetical protein